MYLINWKNNYWTFLSKSRENYDFQEFFMPFQTKGIDESKWIFALKQKTTFPVFPHKSQKAIVLAMHYAVFEPSKTHSDPSRIPS